MPTASERVPNTPLASTELRELLLRDFTRLLDNFSLLTSSTSFPRVAWDIRLSLHTEIGRSPLHETWMQSRAEGNNMIARNPALAAVGVIPLVAPPADSNVNAFEARNLHRVVTSPNEERVRSGLPVPVEVRQTDGHTVTERIKYPLDESLGAGAVRVEDVSRQSGAALGVPSGDVLEFGYDDGIPLEAAPLSESPEQLAARIKQEAAELDLAEQQRLAKLAEAGDGGKVAGAAVVRLPDVVPVRDAAEKLRRVEAEILAEFDEDGA